MEQKRSTRYPKISVENTNSSASKSKTKSRLKTQYSLYDPDLRNLSDAEILYNLINNREKAESMALSLLKNKSRIITRDDLLCLPGIGQKMADKLLMAIEFGRRMVLNSKPEPKKLSNSREAYELIKYDLWDLQNEEFWVAITDRSGSVIKKMRISYGGICETTCDIKIILSEVIKCKGSGLFIFHNHPSGKITPSEGDDKITEKIFKACKLIDTRLLDHLIVAGEKYYSYCDEMRIIF